MNELELELKQLIIDTLELEDINVADIDSHEALFVEGLGLDSIDALATTRCIRRYHIISL